LILILNDEQQKLFISKFSKLTFQSNSYFEITRLKFENNQLKLENELLKNKIKDNENEKSEEQDEYKI